MEHLSFPPGEKQGLDSLPPPIVLHGVAPDALVGVDDGDDDTRLMHFAQPGQKWPIRCRYDAWWVGAGFLRKKERERVQQHTHT